MKKFANKTRSLLQSIGRRKCASGDEQQNQEQDLADRSLTTTSLDEFHHPEHCTSRVRDRANTMNLPTSPTTSPSRSEICPLNHMPHSHLPSKQRAVAVDALSPSFPLAHFQSRHIQHNNKPCQRSHLLRRSKSCQEQQSSSSSCSLLKGNHPHQHTCTHPNSHCHRRHRSEPLTHKSPSTMVSSSESGDQSSPSSLDQKNQDVWMESYYRRRCASVNQKSETAKCNLASWSKAYRVLDLPMEYLPSSSVCCCSSSPSSTIQEGGNQPTSKALKVLGANLADVSIPRKASRLLGIEYRH